jgi:hypothetical protein
MNDHSEHKDHEHSSGQGESSKQPPPHDHEEPLFYYLSGTILVGVKHPAGHDTRDLARLIDGHVEELKKELGSEGESLQNLKKVQSQRFLTFPRLEPEMTTFSIVPIELERNDQQQVIDILMQINKVHHSKPFQLTSSVVWQSESPNWLLGSAGHGKPHPPSPGSWPLTRTAPKEKDWKFSLIDKDSGETRDLPFAEGAKVHVAILDAAPCATDLDEAYEIWHEENELINRLLEPEPNRKLRLVTDFYAEIELSDCSLARHKYPMSWHGTLIAGEIASIAPKSILHLYKVFTDYGSASTLTLAQGLLRILTDLNAGRIETPAIVLCSFSFAVPEAGHYDPNFHPDFPVEFQDSATLQHMQTSLRALFDELTNQDQVIVVAAAGNDSDPEQGRAAARLPAAYRRVIGVGALPKELPKLENGQYIAASYSNLADNPPDTGFMTLGGEPGRGKGILGIYTSETPYYLPKPGENHQEGRLPQDPKEPTRDRLRYNGLDRNKNGSAEIAGTSHSAPIIAGTLARWCSEQLDTGGLITLENARQALINLSQGETTDAGEHVILIKQG